MFKRSIVIAAVGAMLAAMALAPGASAAEPVKLDFNGAIELEGSNGFHVFGLVASFEGKAQVSLVVTKGEEAAIYTARGVGTTNSVDVDFGQLGKVDLEVVPTGKEETIGSKCGGKGKKTKVPASEFVGTLEFHGEGGFTEFTTTHLPLRLNPLLDLLCGARTGVLTTSGASLGGVLVKAKAADGPKLVIQQNHPGAPVFYEAHMQEKEGTVQVSRTVSGHLGAGAIRYAPSLESASFTAAAPFTGSATYTGRTPPRSASPGTGTWRGSLKIDFPGHLDVPLTGPGFKATIVHAHRSETRH